MLVFLRFIMYDEDTFDRIDKAKEIFMNPLFVNWYYEGVVMEVNGEGSMHFLITNNMTLGEKFPDGEFFENSQDIDVLEYLKSAPDEEFAPIIGSDGLEPDSPEDKAQACLIDLDTGRWEYRTLLGRLPKNLETYLEDKLLSFREKDIN
jgi:hypothetical protein